MVVLKIIAAIGAVLMFLVLIAAIFQGYRWNAEQNRLAAERAKQDSEERLKKVPSTKAPVKPARRGR